MLLRGSSNAAMGTDAALKGAKARSELLFDKGIFYVE
jgi:hypothetical protein